MLLCLVPHLKVNTGNFNTHFSSLRDAYNHFTADNVGEAQNIYFNPSYSKHTYLVHTVDITVLVNERKYIRYILSHVIDKPLNTVDNIGQSFPHKPHVDNGNDAKK